MINGGEIVIMDGLHLSIVSERVLNDIDGVVPENGAIPGLRNKLIVIISGSFPGNRDKPLFVLVRAVGRWLKERESIPLPQSGWLFNLLPLNPDAGTEQLSQLRPLDMVLLNFLLSMEDFSHASAVQEAFDILAQTQQNEKALKDCSNTLARRLYAYRVKYLPRERHRQKFTGIMRFLQEIKHSEPEDGDAFAFWTRHGNRQIWTLYKTALEAMMAMSDAIDLERASRLAEPITITDDGNETNIVEQAEEGALVGGNLDDRLGMAIADIRACGIAIFKKTELDDLQRMAGLGRYILKWPRSCAMLLALYPHQASIVQLVKNGAPLGRIAKTAACEGGEDYSDIVGKNNRLSKIMNELRCLPYIVDDKRENPPELSSMIESFNIRQCRVLRRKDFRNRSNEEIARMIAKIDRELEVMTVYIERMQRFWANAFGNGTKAAYENDMLAFSAKLKSLYARDAYCEGGRNDG